VCDDGELCLYTLAQQNGVLFDLGICEDVSAYSLFMNNRIDSVWNRSSYVYTLYTDRGYRGATELVFSGLQELSNANQASSHRCTGS
jgi:hypothetical protein